MSLLAELEAMGRVPRNVKDAADNVQRRTDAKLTPNAEDVSYIRNWVTKQRGQDRYGK